MPDQTRMWDAYLAACRQAEEAWQDGDRPHEVTAISAATGLDPEALWDEVEGVRGWESHDTGYHAMVWLVAWELSGHPDWAGVTPGGGQPVSS